MRNKNVVINYDVEMTSLEGMYFSVWLANVSGIAMNTLYREERKEVAQNWLNEFRNKIV